VTKSSNHTLSLHMLTSNSSSITNFSPLSPTDNWLPYIVAARTTQHRKRGIGADLQKTPACITSNVWRHRARVSSARSRAMIVRVTYRDTSTVACGHDLATADVYRVTSQQQIYTPQYYRIRVSPQLRDSHEIPDLVANIKRLELLGPGSSKGG
jgi:hypothetical protein